MKRIIIIPIVLFSCGVLSVIHGQQYPLFYGNDNKIFTIEHSTDTIAGLCFDSLTVESADTLFWPYTHIGSYINSDTCIFWGTTWCYRQDHPTPLGKKIIRTQDAYKLVSASNDTLVFLMNLVFNDTALIFHDQQQKLQWVYSSRAFCNILGIQDSADVYNLLHTDQNNIPIPGGLHQESVVVGKSLGLTDFFRIDRFPLQYQTLQLAGSTAAGAGLTAITNALLYDHQPGDEIQYYSYYFTPYYPQNPSNYNQYIMHRFLSRTETMDSVSYTVCRTVFDVGATYETTDTIQLNYYLPGLIATIPGDYVDKNNFLLQTRMFQGDYCGLKLWTYTSKRLNKDYCPEDNCWGDYDFNGPPPTGDEVFVCGLGHYLSKNSLFHPGFPSGFSRMKNIIYFKKDGVACGNQVFLATENKEPNVQNALVYPNPISRNLIIEVPGQNAMVVLYTITGTPIISTDATTGTINMDLSHLRAGLYVVGIYHDSGSEYHKIIKR